MKTLNEFLNNHMHKRQLRLPSYQEGFPILYKKIVDEDIQVIDKHELKELFDWLVENKEGWHFARKIVDRLTELIFHEIDPEFESFETSWFASTMPLSFAAIFKKSYFIKWAKKSENKELAEELISDLSKVLNFKDYDKDWIDTTEYLRKLGLIR